MEKVEGRWRDWPSPWFWSLTVLKPSGAFKHALQHCFWQWAANIPIENACGDIAAHCFCIRPRSLSTMFAVQADRLIWSKKLHRERFIEKAKRTVVDPCRVERNCLKQLSKNHQKQAQKGSPEGPGRVPGRSHGGPWEVPGVSLEALGRLLNSNHKFSKIFCFFESL